LLEAREKWVSGGEILGRKWLRIDTSNSQRFEAAKARNMSERGFVHEQNIDLLQINQFYEEGRSRFFRIDLPGAI
jgi:hypothetical protein